MFNLGKEIIKLIISFLIVSYFSLIKNKFGFLPLLTERNQEKLHIEIIT